MTGFLQAALDLLPRRRVTVEQMRQEVRARLKEAGSLLTAQLHQQYSEFLLRRTGRKGGDVPFVPTNFFERMLGEVDTRGTAIMGDLTLRQIKNPRKLSPAERKLLELNGATDAKPAKNVVIAAYDPNEGSGGSVLEP